MLHRGNQVNTRLGLCLVGFLTLLGTFHADAIAAERHALLIGVSRYPSLSADMQLEGPANDVRLIRRLLLERGFQPQNIRVLAEGQDSDSPPTRPAILAAMQNLFNEVKRGDFVYLHFSGHGSQQPALRTRGKNVEPDGLDEIFLPQDIGHWDGTIGQVHNAIVDDEFDVLLSRLRNRGATVWAVFDSCHSGTLTRGPAKAAMRIRSVHGSILGVPTGSKLTRWQAGMGTKERPADATRQLRPEPLKADAGGLVAFFAVRSDEETPEVRFQDGKFYGLFTYTLSQVLMDHPGTTYRRAVEQVRERYAERRWRYTPQFEGGALLDMPTLEPAQVK